MRYKRALLLILLLGSHLGSIRIAHAQWREMLAIPSGRNFNCGYFWSLTNGVIAGLDILYYMDGSNWFMGKAPTNDSIFSYMVKSIRSFDNTTLYAAASRPYLQTWIPECWISTDSGKTWSVIPAKHYPDTMVFAEDVYLLPDGSPAIVGSSLPLGSSAGTGMSCIARIDSRNLICAADDGLTAYYSTDGGITWIPSFYKFLPDGSLFNAGYSAYYDCESGISYISGEGSTPYPLARSTDYGRTWSVVQGNLSSFGFQGEDVGDVMNGKYEQLYVQCEQLNHGILHSSDNGITWHDIGGPPQPNEDIRLCIEGSEGKTVIAFGWTHPKDSATVWLYDGGDFYGQDPSSQQSFLALNGNKSAAAGQTITYTVTPNTGLTTDTISFTLSFNSNILELLMNDSLFSILDTVQENGIMYLRCQWILDHDSSLNLPFRVYLSDSTSTRVQIDSISASTLPSLTCLPLGLAPVSALFSTQLHCDSTMLHLLRQQPILQQLHCFPNPASNEITIAITNSNESSMEIEIFNQLGSIVHREQYSSSKEIPLQCNTDVSSWPSGIYHVRVSDGVESTSSEFIVGR